MSLSPRSQRLPLVIQTTMSTTLPPEILDLIADHLGLDYEFHTLKTCCLVSKSWIPRARKYLFAYIQFTETSYIKRWRKSFPDPSNSPAYYTRGLSFIGLPTATDTDADIGSWIHAFPRVVRLSMTIRWWNDRQISLPQFRGFFPNLKTIRLAHSSIPLSDVFSLICSFPLLENLDIDSGNNTDGWDGWDVPSTSPKLNGSLSIRGEGTRSTVRRLCDLPGGLRFSNVTVSFYKEDVELIMDLVSRCSDTLESFTISYDGPWGAFTSASMIGQDLTTAREVAMSRTPREVGVSRTPPLDLSKATKLKDIELSCNESDVQWVTTTVQTATPKSLRQITVTMRTNPYLVEETDHRELQDLDRILVQLWISRSIRPKVIYEMIYGDFETLHWLPGLARGGFIKVVDLDKRGD